MVDTVPNSLLDKNPYDLILNCGLHARQMGTFFTRDHTIENTVDFPETGLGQGYEVILVIVEKCDIAKGSTEAMDNFFSTLLFLKDTHREKAPSNKTPALRKSTNIGFCTVGTLNQLFIRGS